MSRLNTTGSKEEVYIRIRKENFGYIFFEKFTREHYFVTEVNHLENLSPEEIKKVLRQYFSNSKKIKYEFITYQVSSLDLSAPVGMYMEISKRCNLSCKHCYKPREKTKEEMGINGIKELVSELGSIGVFEVRLCGNEPTASPYFLEACRCIKDHNMYLGVNTNAFFDSEMQEKIIELRPDFVVISVDGPQEIHDCIRVTGSYNKAISFLNRLAQTNIKRRINTLLSRITINSIEYIAQLAEKNGADVSFLPLRSIGRDTKFKDDEAINSEDMFFAVKEITKLRSKYPDTTLLTYFDLLSEKATYHHSMDFNKPCPSRKNGFITYNGDFFPCDFLRYLGDKYFCGNVMDNGFNVLWKNSPILKSFQCLEHKKCVGCKFYMTKCYGGCISGAIASTDKPDDELCFAHILGV